MIMAATELSLAKKNVTDVLGDDMKIYLQLLKSWFKQKCTREEFDSEARKLLPKNKVHLHNEFLLAIISKCQAFSSSLVTKDLSLVNRQLNASQKLLKKAKLRRKAGVSRSTFQHSFVPIDALKHAPQAVPKAKAPDEDGAVTEFDYYPKVFCVREMTLPDINMINGRMLVNAWEFGLDDVEETAVRMMMVAVEMQLKNIIEAVISRKGGYKIREKKFRYAIGTPQPNPYLTNSNDLMDYTSESYETSVTANGALIPTIRPSSEVAEMEAATALACSMNSQLPRYPVTLFDLLEGLQVYKQALPSHTVYSSAMENIVSKMWHPSNEQLEQDHIQRQENILKHELSSQGPIHF